MKIVTFSIIHLVESQNMSIQVELPGKCLVAMWTTVHSLVSMRNIYLDMLFIFSGIALIINNHGPMKIFVYISSTNHNTPIISRPITYHSC